MLLKLFSLIIIPLLALIIHEFSHYIIAYIKGIRIKFLFKINYLYNIPVIRYVWNMPKNNLSQNYLDFIHISGFAGEILFSLILFLLNIPLYFIICYFLFTLVHLFSYPIYTKNDKYNDFNNLNKNNILRKIFGSC